SGSRDVAAYQLYRGDEAAFTPGPGNLVATSRDTVHVDRPPVSKAMYYKLSAIDVHGNESEFVGLGPIGSVGGPTRGLPSELLLAAPAPNPASGGTLVRLGLPRTEHVLLIV